MTTRRITFDASQLHPDTVTRIHGLHRQLLEFPWTQLGPDFRTAITAKCELLGQADSHEGERVGGGDISNPTLGQMFRRQQHTDDVDEMVSEGIEALAHLNLFLRRIAAVTVVARAPEMAQVRDANRCYSKPEFHVAPWYRADCGELIVHPGTPWGGLCHPCYQRARRYYERITAQGAA